MITILFLLVSALRPRAPVQEMPRRPRSKPMTVLVHPWATNDYQPLLYEAVVQADPSVRIHRSNWQPRTRKSPLHGCSTVASLARRIPSPLADLHA